MFYPPYRCWRDSCGFFFFPKLMAPGCSCSFISTYVRMWTFSWLMAGQLLRSFSKNYADIKLLCSLLEALCCCWCFVGEKGAINSSEDWFSKSAMVHDGTAGTFPFLNICSQRKSKYCCMATPHWMGTFDYNHWGILEHFSFPLFHQSRSSKLECLVTYCITVYFIYPLLHLWRMPLFIVVARLAWRKKILQTVKNK